MTDETPSFFEIAFKRGKRVVRRISEAAFDRSEQNPHWLTFNAHDPRWKWPVEVEGGDAP